MQRLSFSSCSCTCGSVILDNTPYRNNSLQHTLLQQLWCRGNTKTCLLRAKQ